MKKLIIILILALFSQSLLQARGGMNKVDTKKIYGDAQYYYLFGQYEKALESYKELLNENPENGNLHYKIGLCYLQLPNSNYLKEALLHMEKAVETAETSYRDNYKETRAPVVAWIYYGDALRLNYQFEKAYKAYTMYQELVPNDSEFEDYLKREKSHCKAAQELMDNPIIIDAQNSEHDISRREEFESCPVVSEDESMMVFAYGSQNILPPNVISISDVDFYKTDDIYYAQKVNGLWENSVNITKDLGLNKNAMPVSISPDGKTLLLVQDDNDNGNIYQSLFDGSHWSKAEKLGKPINSKAWETHAFLANNGNTIYFTSDRRGGNGGFDIYKSEKLENGKWGKAENLGSNINTEYDEDTPFLTADGSKLYFSSQGHQNMGGYDIYESDWNNGDWSEPKNVGFPLNTPGNDLFYMNQKDGNLAFAPLNDDNLRKTEAQNNDNWFTVSTRQPILKVIAEIRLAGEEQQAFTDIHVDTSGLMLRNYKIENQTLSFETDFKDLLLAISAQGTDTVNLQLNQPISCQDVTENLVAELHLVKSDVLADASVDDSHKAPLNTTVSSIESISKEVYFGFDKSGVSSNFDADIEAIYQAWLKDSSKTIQIDGFADPVGNETYNLKLSQRRADAVKAAVIKKGVKAELINSTGRGETSENSNNYYNRKAVITLL
ncbi:MAG: PD40 domain-containing protein [Bacteroidales bacterium]|nr:PD40 domain-containing protein [Bacteroidales bacterium]